LTPGVLRAWRIDGLMVDVDNTVMPWGTDVVPAHVVAWAQGLRAAGIPICLVSNSLSRRARAAAAQIDAPIARGRFKPSRAKLRDALARLGTAPRRTAMVGDQLFTDVLAGNRLGVPTVLTDPLASREPVRIRVVRVVERRLLAYLARRGLAPATAEV